jgi:hypothetical protein
MNEVLAAVSRDVRGFQERLPDFVCDERITSTASESGTLRTMKIVESVFTAVQKPNPLPGNGQSTFTETREITAIDGKAVRKGTAMPKLPLAMFGGFSDLLSMTFSAENPRDLSRLKNTVEYGLTAIGDREFWLPLIMRSDATDRDPRKTKIFLADYTNCRKFTTDIRLAQ